MLGGRRSSLIIGITAVLPLLVDANSQSHAHDVTSFVGLEKHQSLNQ